MGFTRLSSVNAGDTVTVDHPDYLFMPPARNWVLWVKPEGHGLQFVPTAHIAAIDLESHSISSQQGF